MKQSPPPRHTTTEKAVWTGYFVLLLLVIPMLPLGKYGGGLLMLVGALVGLVGYVIFHGTELLQASRMKCFVLTTAVSCLASAVLAAVFLLMLTR